MEHPFFDDTSYIQETELTVISGGNTLSVPFSPAPVAPRKPPVYYTQAIGENGGPLPALPVL